MRNAPAIIRTSPSISIGIAYMVTEGLFLSGVAFLGLRLVYLSIVLANRNKKEKKSREPTILLKGVSSTSHKAEMKENIVDDV